MKIFLDACAIIYWLESGEPYYSKLHNKLNQIRKKYGPLPFVISALSLLECRVKPLRENNVALMKAYHHFFSAPNLSIISLTAAVLEQATSLRAFHNIRTPDALQAASALTASDNTIMFVTGDAFFKKIEGLEVVLL
jgi:uncharacterized protein